MLRVGSWHTTPPLVILQSSMKQHIQMAVTTKIRKIKQITGDQQMLEQKNQKQKIRGYSSQNYGA